MQEYKLAERNGQYFTEIDGKSVCIYGCGDNSYSIVPRTHLTFLGRKFYIQRSIDYNQLRNLRGYYGNIIEVLLGWDILGLLNFDIDAANKTLRIYEEPLPVQGYMIPTREKRTIPNINTMIDSKPAVGRLLTNISISYIRREFVEGLTPYRTHQGLFMNQGGFETPVYRLPISIADENFEMDFGASHPINDDYCFPNGLDVFLGNEIFKKFNMSYRHASNLCVLSPKDQPLAQPQTAKIRDNIQRVDPAMKKFIYKSSTITASDKEDAIMRLAGNAALSGCLTPENYRDLCLHIREVRENRI